MKILHDDVASIIYYSSGWMLLLMGFIVHFFTVAFMMHIIFEKKPKKTYQIITYKITLFHSEFWFFQKLHG